jgi:S-(hydroxymethyl)glutathione dehydrogenase/alcohol dehydrogenase
VPLEITELLRPPLEEGQILVRLRHSGVCGSQLMEARGLRGVDPWLPHLLGHEGVGIVVATGPKVSKVAEGDRVILSWIAGAGISAAPPVFSTVAGETINAGRVTTFSEFTVVSENRVYLAPKEVNDRTAVLFGCALLTGIGMVLNQTSLEPGQPVLVNGAGGVGLAVLIGSLIAKLEPVVADPDPTKREIARTLGAVHVFDPLSNGDVRAFRSLYPDGVDAAFDASGRISAVEFAFESIKFQGGLLILASHPPAGEFMRLDPHALIRGKRIRGSWGGESRPDQDIPRIARMLANRGLDLGFMTPQSYPLEDVNRALQDLEAGWGVRPLISMAHH